MSEAVIVLLNEAMKLDRERHLKATPYERNSARQGYANGFKPKTLQTRLGSLPLAIPQVRQSDSAFYPACLEKGQRSERALKTALAEMYIQGVSTRKVKAVTEKLCGYEVTSTQVSRITQELDGPMQKWRDRPLGQFLYLIVDARYEKVRHVGQVIDNAVLIAFGIDASGKRHVLGVSVSLSEAEVHWRAFLESLIKRGLHGVEMIISDAHSGLKAARQAVFPSVPWQRCQFHLQQNASSYVPKQSLKKGVAKDIRDIFNAPNEVEAQRLLKMSVEKYAQHAPKLADWMESNIAEGFAVFSCPEAYWKKLRTSNLAERINKEIKRRTRVVSIFPNEEACLRLVSALLIEQDEEWTHAKAYLPIETA
jgi:transposase-like protein